jgi:Fe-S cluster assembly ATP-binding protein
MSALLEVKNLYVSTKGKEILRGVNLRVKNGQIHALMGENGSGKTTFAKILVGAQEEYEIKGKISFFGKNLLKMAPEQRARRGIFLAFQSPIEIPGVSFHSFLMSSLNEIRKYQREKPLDPLDLMNSIDEKARLLGLKNDFLSRGFNEGASGGERKKNEILQLMFLKPRLVILDEIDSGLDIDSLKKAAEVLQEVKQKNNAFLIITHYPRILNYIKPNFVHILYEGRIVKSGNFKLAFEVEKNGYKYFY